MKILFALLLTVILIAGSSEAHCGGCSTDKKHDHKNAEKTSTKMKTSSIIETARSAKSFNTLLAAVEAAGLVDALSGEGPFTVFAPTDDAFAKLPKGTVESLLKDKKKLASILTYHVVDGIVKAEEVVKIDRAQTLNGQSVSIEVKKEKVMIDNAMITTTDVICSNGIIHVIDAVILPKDKK